MPLFLTGFLGVLLAAVDPYNYRDNKAASRLKQCVSYIARFSSDVGC